MHGFRAVRGTAAAAAAIVLMAASTVGGRAPAAPDPLAAEIARWTTVLKTTTATDDEWVQLRQATEPVLARAAEALGRGRRLLALLRLAAVRENIAGAAYMRDRPAPALDNETGFEAEWTRVGKALQADLSPAATTLAGVTPAAVRAIGEAALPKVRDYYQASLDYGRNTTVRYGFFYLGVAQAAKDFAAMCRALATSSPLRAPALHPLGQELDDLEADVLAVYRPPVSIDRHPEFIGASAALKEARELDAAGLRDGALLRYLQAALRFAPLRARPPAALGEPASLSGSARARHAWPTRAWTTASGGCFLEMAQSDLDAAAPPRPRDRRAPSPTTCCRATSRRSSPARPRAAAARRRGSR